MNKKFHLALQDIYAGITHWRIWLLLSWQDIRLRYRRSQIGPFWLTISMAVTMYSMGLLYGKLFKMDLHYYFPFLASGLLAWALISVMITESTNSLIDAGNYLKQIKLPYVIFILRVVTRNIIIFFHNILAIIPVMIYCHIPIGWHTLFLLIGVLIVGMNGVVFGLIFGMLGARFRDIEKVLISLIQVIFFVTPVMWAPKILPAKYKYIADYNPFTHYIELIRAPLMGNLPSLNNYIVTLGFTAIGLVLMMWLFTRSRHRIIYWL